MTDALERAVAKIMGQATADWRTLIVPLNDWSLWKISGPKQVVEFVTLAGVRVQPNDYITDGFAVAMDARGDVVAVVDYRSDEAKVAEAVKIGEAWEARRRDEEEANLRAPGGPG